MKHYDHIRYNNQKNTVAKIPSPYILNSPRKPLLSREFTDIWHHKKWES